MLSTLFKAEEKVQRKSFACDLAGGLCVSPFGAMEPLLVRVCWEWRHYAYLLVAVLMMLETDKVGCTTATENQRGLPQSCAWAGIPHHFVFYQDVLPALQSLQLEEYAIH